MAEITSEGYQLDNQNVWFENERDLYLAIDANWNLDPSTPDGLKLAHDAEVFGSLDELGLQAYNSKDPNKAQGVDLDTLCAITGTTREDGTPSTVAVQVGGVNGTIVTQGAKIKSSVDETEWEIDANITIAAGVGNGTATALVNGATQADTGTITEVVDTIAGWQTVTNTAPAAAGTNAETDGQLRLKRNQAVGKPGNNQVESMLGEISEVEDVRKFLIYNNRDNSPDVNGIPGHSMAVLVEGGTDTGVAQAIYNKLSPGVGLYQAGTPISEVITSELYPQQSETILFGRPTYKNIAVVVHISNDGSLPADVADEIKEAIINYSEGTFTATAGFNTTGFEISENVPASRLYTPVNSVIGRYGNSYILGLTVDGSGVSTTVGFDELAKFTEGNISVVI